jgi:hypothetical protein
MTKIPSKKPSNSEQENPIDDCAVRVATRRSERQIVQLGRLNRHAYERAMAALSERDDALKAVTLPRDPGSIPDGRPLRWSF